MEKELEHLRRRNECLKTEFEQEKQVFPVTISPTTNSVAVFFSHRRSLPPRLADHTHEKCMCVLCIMSQCEVNDLQQQLSQQADYCTSMGAACCTLLWRVSRQEDSIHSILSGVSRSRSGRPKISSARQDRALVNLCLKDRRKTSVDLKKEWEEASGVVCSTRTVYTNTLPLLPFSFPSSSLSLSLSPAVQGE